MREIKFRVFQDNEMIYQDAPGVYGTKHFLDKCYEDGILMQYTGLKDKNNIEIYDGDIVTVYHTGEVGLTGTVEYDDDETAYMIRTRDFESSEIVGTSFSRHLEVIGNIHENPELK